MRRSFLLAAFSFAALLSFRAEAACGTGDDTDWKQGELARLSPSIGTYRTEAVLDDPAVRGRLEALAGDLAPEIRLNLGVSGPVAFTGTSLVLRGSRPHDGVDEQALVLVRPCDGLVQAALLHAGRVVVFKGPEDAQGEIRLFAASRASRAAGRVETLPVPAAPMPRPADPPRSPAGSASGAAPG